METTDKQRIETEPAKSAIYELITQSQIDTNLTRLRSEFDIDLEGVTIHSAKPGDPLFDKYEIQHKLLQKCGSDFEKLLTKIKAYGYSPDGITVEELRDIARRENIVLEGSLPGFAMTAGDGEIVFFAVNGSNAIDMATNYAVKEGESSLTFRNVEEAVRYLRGLADKTFFHEIAHIVYSRGEFHDWDTYIATKPEIKEQVIRLQKDKYGDISQIPIAEEAFADFSIEVLSNGQIISRLGKNEEATNKVKKEIKTLGGVALS